MKEIRKTKIPLPPIELQKYKRGEMRLPEIQRHYVWHATRVHDLLDLRYRSRK